MIMEALNEMNENVGQVADASTDSSYIFVWSSSKGMRSISPGSHRRFPAAIDDRGVVAGTYQVEGGMQGGPNHAFIWTQGKTVDLGTLGGRNSGASDMNERGVVVGTAENERNETHVVIWRTR
jgi:probable HAF family extracellular repeat protein